jgi:hypothetical protein
MRFGQCNGALDVTLLGAFGIARKQHDQYRTAPYWAARLSTADS